MTILKRQIDELFKRTLLGRLQEGRPPSTSELTKVVNQFIKDRPSGGPMMRVRYQDRRRRWDVAKQNQTLEELEIDLKVMFQEFFDLSRQMLARHNFTEVAYLSQSRQLAALTAELDNLLFVTANADDRFFGVFDSFDDMSKINVSASTEGVVDLSEGALVLPSGALSTHKIPLNHLYDAGVWTVGVTLAAGTLVNNEPGTDAPFGNAFHDVVSAWRQDVLVTEKSPVSISFTIPIGLEGQEISLTRIQLISHSVYPMRVEIETSTDNVNYTSIPEVSTILLETLDKEYNVDFGLKRMQYIRFRVTKDTPDEETVGQYRYSFGFKHIGLYTVGRVSQAEMVSKTLVPQGMVDAISQVSLYAMERIPSKCLVRWFLKGIDASGEDVGEWRAVAPVNRSSTDLSTLLRFGNDQVERKRISGASSSSWSSYRNNILYALGESALPTGETAIDVVFNTAKLIRGLGMWARNRREEKVLKQVRDVYADFGFGLRQKLAAVLKESARVTLRKSPSKDELVTHLTVTEDIDYDPLSMTVVPNVDTDVDQDVASRYAVHKVHLVSSKSTYEDQTLSGVAFAPIAFPHANVLLTGVSAPVVTSSNGEIPYKEDEDYVLEKDPVSGHATFRVPEVNAPTGGGNWKVVPSKIQNSMDVNGNWSVLVTYTLDPNVTSLVETVQGKTVIMTRDMKQADDAYFEVFYRFLPIGDYTIRKSSLRVTSNFGQDEGTAYTEGPDYTIDVERGVITKIPQGAIGNVAYVDFVYEAPSSALETHTLWAFFEGRDPVKAEFNNLDLDLDAGEQFFIRHGADTLELTRLNETPELLYGWHQFVVRSKDPDQNDVSAIARVANLRDNEGNPNFVAGGR